MCASTRTRYVAHLKLGSSLCGFHPIYTYCISRLSICILPLEVGTQEDLINVF